MRQIFLSYRREDSSAYAGRLFDHLTSHFGEGSVFMDTASIKTGRDAVETIGKSLESSDVVLVVIGKKWLASFSKRAKQRRMDHVRLEILMALNQKLPIIPVLVARVEMPHQEDLPEDLQTFGRRQAFEISDNHFYNDVNLLIHEIEELVGKPEPPQGSRSEPEAESTLVVAGIDELLSWGWDGKQFLQTLFDRDKETIEGLSAEYSGTIDQWIPIVMNHPYTWRIIVDKPGSIVGNWHFVSFDEAMFRKALRGTLRDKDITEDKVRYMDMPGWYDIYFLAVFLLPRFRQRLENLLLLRKSILDHFTDLARQGVFINRICTHAYTPAGESFCKSFDLKPGHEHIDRGRIYWRKFYPLPQLPIFDEYKDLNRLYEQAVKDGQ